MSKLVIETKDKFFAYNWLLLRPNWLYILNFVIVTPSAKITLILGRFLTTIFVKNWGTSDPFTKHRDTRQATTFLLILGYYYSPDYIYLIFSLWTPWPLCYDLGCQKTNFWALAFWKLAKIVFCQNWPTYLVPSVFRIDFEGCPFEFRIF